MSPIRNQYDVIVIGAGHNGLTTAALLAKSGRKVLVLEKRDVVGGLAAGEEFHPGYRSPGLLNDTTNISAEIIDTLHLERFGLRFHKEWPGIFFPDSNGKGIVFNQNPVLAQKEIAQYSTRDAEQYQNYREFIERIRGFVRNIMHQPPPDVFSTQISNLFKLAKAAFSLRGLGSKDMTELLRVAPMCVADFLNDWFATELLKAGMSGPAYYGSCTAPWSPLNTLNLLLWETQAERPVIGGGQALIHALQASAKSFGVEIRTHANVSKILVQQGKVNGVLLDNGETLSSSYVAASCDPKTTFHQLLNNDEISHQLDQRIANYRMRGSTAKVNLALNAALEFRNREGQRFEYIRIGESLDGIEQSFDPMKYGDFAENLTMDLFVPTIAEPKMAPAGHHVASILVHFVPYHLKGGWTDQRRTELQQRVVQTLARYTLRLAEKIVASEVLTPWDIEQRYSTKFGHIFHGEHAPDQLFTRPTPETAHYATPIAGLFLCGSGAHPGGGLTCWPGALGTDLILKHSQTK